jgi:hypothetical protein
LPVVEVETVKLVCRQPHLAPVESRLVVLEFRTQTTLPCRLVVAVAVPEVTALQQPQALAVTVEPESLRPSLEQSSEAVAVALSAKRFQVALVRQPPVVVRVV